MSQTRTQKLNPTEKDLRRVTTSINKIVEGRTDNYGNCTLAANTAQTVVEATFVGSFSTVVLTPTSANAAAEVGAGTLYVSAKANGSFTLTHANNAQTDRTFDYTWSG